MSILKKEESLNNHFLNDSDAIERIFNHIDNGTTDLGNTIWKEPVRNYYSQERFDAEIALLRKSPIPYCPSAGLPENGSYIARRASGTPLLVVRGEDGVVRAFINACKHRGMKVADGSGCKKKAFVCPYHAWAYGLNGKLKNIPGQEAFPNLDNDNLGLSEISAIEKGGIVYVMQEGKIEDHMLENAIDFFEPEQKMFSYGEVVDEANWKLLTETLLEGYHIKSLHKDTFYPFGLDNINLVETSGPNSRVIFPFKRIEKIRHIEPNERKLNGVATSVFHLFPNASVSILSKHSSLTIMEPLSPSSVKIVSYLVYNPKLNGKEISLEDAEKDAKFVNESGQNEDREAARAIQETVTTSANSYLTFGFFEKAIVNFHQHLTSSLDK
jgi:phenylpropionate dioxygenase-like ring-hydroxylating dioxygenase large terminal subunit